MKTGRLQSWEALWALPTGGQWRKTWSDPPCVSPFRHVTEENWRHGSIPPIFEGDRQLRDDTEVGLSGGHLPPPAAKRKTIQIPYKPSNVPFTIPFHDQASDVVGHRGKNETNDAMRPFSISSPL